MIKVLSQWDWVKREGARVLAHSAHMQGAYRWAGGIENGAGKCLIS